MRSPKNKVDTHAFDGLTSSTRRSKGCREGVVVEAVDEVCHRSGTVPTPTTGSPTMAMEKPASIPTRTINDGLTAVEWARALRELKLHLESSVQRVEDGEMHKGQGEERRPKEFAELGQGRSGAGALALQRSQPLTSPTGSRDRP